MSRLEGGAPTMDRPADTAEPHVASAAPAPDRPEPDVSPGPRRASEAAFEALYRAELRSVVAVVHSLTGRRDVAEEIAQDAFVVTHDRWARVGTYDRPADFVRRVALNRALSSLRRRQAERRALERWQGRAATVATPGMQADDESGLWAAVRRLPARQAQVVALLYVEDQPIPRIAEILDCSENTVKTHLKRARATLALALAQSQPQPQERAT